MATKKDFFSQSFTKNKVTATPSVPDEPKVVKEKPIPKIDKQIAINQVLEDLHEPNEDKSMRLTLDISPEMHRKIKMRAAEQGVSMKAYAKSLFEKDLKGK